MRVAVLTIGDELLGGYVVDTNFTRIASWMTSRGHEVVAHASAGDDEAAIGRALDRLAPEAELVLISGGLGPTPDDVTVDAVARWLARPVVQSSEILEALQAAYLTTGRPMPRATRRIARVIEGAALVENPVGQAPCQWIETPNALSLALLPGVPGELAAILEQTLSARVALDRSRAGRTFRTVGIAESTLSAQLDDRGVTGVAYLPWIGGVDVRLPPGAPPAILDALAAVAGDALVGEGTPGMATLVVERLASLGRTLSIAESVTGGAIAARIVAVPGASRVFEGGVVAYSDRIKAHVLGVRAATLNAHGPVSEAVTREMAERMRERTGTSHAIATTGIAGPSGEGASKPIGLVWLALARSGETLARSHTFAGDRAGIIERSVVAALDMLRRASMPDRPPGKPA